MCYRANGEVTLRRIQKVEVTTFNRKNARFHLFPFSQTLPKRRVPLGSCCDPRSRRHPENVHSRLSGANSKDCSFYARNDTQHKCKLSLWYRDCSSTCQFGNSALRICIVAERHTCPDDTSKPCAHRTFCNDSETEPHYPRVNLRFPTEFP